MIVTIVVNNNTNYNLIISFKSFHAVPTWVQFFRLGAGNRFLKISKPAETHTKNCQNPSMFSARRAAFPVGVLSLFSVGGEKVIFPSAAHFAGLLAKSDCTVEFDFDHENQIPQCRF